MVTQNKALDAVLRGDGDARVGRRLLRHLLPGRARAARRSSASGCGTGHIERALALYQRHGLLALMVPALLPPPAPFKLFVLMAGVAKVRPLQFVAAIAVARGARYLALGVLAIYYGDAALELMRTHGRDGRAVARRRSSSLAAVAWWLLQRRSARSRSRMT